MRNLAKEMKKCLINNELDKIGELLHENWIEKKQLAQGITNPWIDSAYKKAIKAGATGGKICGAGGGGFLLFYCKKENQNRVKQALQNLEEVPFSFEPNGSQILHNKQ